MIQQNTILIFHLLVGYRGGRKMLKLFWTCSVSHNRKALETLFHIRKLSFLITPIWPSMRHFSNFFEIVEFLSFWSDFFLPINITYIIWTFYRERGRVYSRSREVWTLEGTLPSFADRTHLIYHWKAVWPLFHVLHLPRPTPTMALFSKFSRQPLTSYIVEKSCNHFPHSPLPLCHSQSFTFNIF